MSNFECCLISQQLSYLSSGEISLVGSPPPDLVKITMYDGLSIIVPVQDKGSRLVLSEIAHLIEGINSVLIHIIPSLM